MAPFDKPILDTEGQISHLKSKGVKFEIMSDEDARDYLNQNNNYFKLRAYRKNFPKHPDGELKGKYIDLDFAMLKDLAIIDMRLRYTLIHMALDVEHFAKVRLLKAIEKSNEDGYSIVDNYMMDIFENDSKNGTHRYQVLEQELNRNRGNPYCGGIISRYDGYYPIWAFVEIIPLGAFIDFYGYCARRLGDKKLIDEFYLLNSIKKIRNAAAHSNCIIHDMGENNNRCKTNYKVIQSLNSISSTTRKKRLKNERMQQIVTLLYTHTVLVTSSGVHDYERTCLKEVVNRMYKHIDYYANNELITKNFDFFKKVVDIFFP